MKRQLLDFSWKACSFNILIDIDIEIDTLFNKCQISSYGFMKL